MTKPRFPTMGDPSTWKPFDRSDAFDIACEVERRLALRHAMQRTRKPQCNDLALFTGLMMATVQVYAAAMRCEMLTDEDRQRLHEALDFATVAGVDAFHHGGTKQ